MHLNKDKLNQGKKARKQESKKGRKKETAAYQLLIKLHRNAGVDAGIDSSIDSSIGVGASMVVCLHVKDHSITESYKRHGNSQLQ